jgi:hypothetical protein
MRKKKIEKNLFTIVHSILFEIDEEQNFILPYNARLVRKNLIKCYENNYLDKNASRNNSSIKMFYSK